MKNEMTANKNKALGEQKPSSLMDKARPTMTNICTTAYTADSIPATNS